jgi:hypothetical protein
VTTDDHQSWHDDDVLSVRDAARVAQRSARTIRRAYLSGKLVAHRDGNGRGVRVLYGDLRAWLLAELVAPRSAPASSEIAADVDVTRARPRVRTGNLELLTATRRRRVRRARASANAQRT